jgi:hypothetical protein
MRIGLAVEQGIVLKKEGERTKTLTAENATNAETSLGL